MAVSGLDRVAVAMAVPVAVPMAARDRGALGDDLVEALPDPPEAAAHAGRGHVGFGGLAWRQRRVLDAGGEDREPLVADRPGFLDELTARQLPDVAGLDAV